MKKLIFALMAVCFSFALATPVFADVPAGAILFEPIALLAVLILIPRRYPDIAIGHIHKIPSDL